MLVSRPSNEIQFDLHINRKVPYGCNYAYRKNSVHRIGDRTMGRFDRATVDVGRWTSEIVRRRSFSSSCAFAALLSTTLAERRGRNVWSFRLSAAPSFVDIFCPPRSYLTYKKMADTDRASCIIIRPTRARNTSLRASSFSSSSPPLSITIEANDFATDSSNISNIIRTIFAMIIEICVWIFFLKI